MKKIHIIAILAILVAAVVLISASGDVSTYATFDAATESGSRVKISGELVKSKKIVYNPSKDPNYFSFFIEDSDGVSRQVVLDKAKPQDFEMSESIVVTGSMKEDIFYADDILLKCPSKYKNEEISIRNSG
jgi:cytochrome c-type biogenesis protein CcmE